MAEPIEIEHLLNLPKEERSRIAKALLESLHGETDGDADTVWVEELERRATDARENSEDLMEGSEVHARLSSRLQNK